ncbi:DUF3078 domain-containing protein [Larkinella terrae]|uniref:DUF3078 domain-containing protein n=1 Tax=Larkinella terrae TaxID=2025311 RepID=A0A7K0EPB4_9BACT|nr:DUF3078 domain-containing protein [Larkinella terrae]MRS63665.1 DUF3078 domain-containing protein [Larkinella terrae]
MKKFAFILFLIGWNLSAMAQKPTRLDSIKVIPLDTVYWKRSAQAGINLNQGSFSSNWKGGGVNSIALGAFFNAKSDYMQRRFNWTSEAQLQYGIVKNQGQDSRKNVDRIFLDTKVGYRLNQVWLAFGNINFLSQFATGYRYEALPGGGERNVLISNFFAPAYLTESMGLEYKPTTYFNLQFGLGTIRQTFVTDDAISIGVPTRYGVLPGKTVRNEFAFQLIANFDRNVAENLNVKARYQMFANYSTLNAIDHRLDVSLTAKVNRFVNVSLTGIVLYDKDQDNAIQYSQGLAIGFLYSF